MKLLHLFCNLLFLINISQFKLLYNNNTSFQEHSVNNKNIKRKLNSIYAINNLVNIESLNDIVSYISSIKNNNGDIYITTNIDNSTSVNRLVYIIKSDYTQESKVLAINTDYNNKYPLMTYLTISSKEYLTSFSHEGQVIELISYDDGKIYPCSIYKGMNRNALIQKNTFTCLKYYDYRKYILNAFIEKKNSNFLIQKIYIPRSNITYYGFECTQKNVGEAKLNSTVTCFEVENYIECLYTNSDLLYSIVVFDIDSLDNVYNETLDTEIVKVEEELFSKCIHIKSNVGAFIYFIDENQFPRLYFKNLEINNNSYQLKDYIDNISVININSKGSFSLKCNYLYNDIIKSNENNIFYINTEYDGTQIYVIIIKLLNNDKNVLLNYYEIKLNDNFKIAIYKDITVFSLNGLLGIGMTHYNYNLDINKTYSSFFIFGNITINDDISINIPNNTNIFNEENNYEIKISEIVEKIEISNNAFGYIFAGIKIPLLDEDNLGFYIYSNSNDKKIKQNEIILINDTIIFKMNSTLGVKLGQYSIEYQIIIKEPEFEDFISYPNLIEYYPKNDSIDNEVLYKTFFEPDTFSGRISYINFKVDKCYIKCNDCNYYGDELNHHCDNCPFNYIFSLSIINGNNCLEECPENYIYNNYKCIKGEENNEDNIEEENNEDYIEEEENNEDNNEEENNEDNNEEENNEDNIEEENNEDNNEEENNEDNIEEEKKEDNNEEENNEDNNEEENNEGNIEEEKYEDNFEEKKNYENNKEESITEKEENKYMNEEEKRNNIEEEKEKNKDVVIKNDCKKYFYIDENLKINCIDGDICIDDYPHIDRNINNMCTNCIVKYNNKCYIDCPINTCIKQDLNLDTCIDIDNNTKVINQICFENFDNLTHNLKEMSDNNIIIQNIPNLTVYVYNIKKDINYFKENQLTYIHFKDIMDILIKEYNLDKNANIYALMVDSPSKYSNSTINDYGFVLLLENGTELDLSKIKKELKVNVSIPIINLDLANYNYATLFSEQGYDIYDQNSEFYHDICTPGYLNDNDLTLQDRQKEIFPNNMTIGKSNCEYQLTDLNKKRFIYSCNISEINENNTNNNAVNFFEDEDENENFFDIILDMLNYKILNCSSLFFDLDNFRHNKAVIICTLSIFVTTLLMIIFFCSRLSKIRIEKFNHIPDKQKLKKLLIEKRKKSLFIKKHRIMNPSRKRSKTIKHKKGKKIDEMKIVKTHISLGDCNITYKKSKKFRREISIDNLIPKITVKKGFCNINISEKKTKNIKEKYLDEYDDLPFKIAIIIDKRSTFYIFKIKIVEKIKIIDICVNKKIKEIALSIYFLYLIIDLTMNALLYSDQIVSHKSHNNGQLDTILALSLSALANIFASIIEYYLEKLVEFENKIDQIDEIKREHVYLRVLKIVIREMKIRVVIFFFCEIIVIFLCTYYLFIFFTIYHQSQMSLLKSYLFSLLESWLINFLVAFFIVIFRKLGIYFRNKYIYNTSKYLDKNF